MTVRSGCPWVAGPFAYISGDEQGVLKEHGLIS